MLTRIYTKTLAILSFSLLSLSAVSQEKNNDDIARSDIQRFSNAISIIKHYYVKNTSDSELFDNAIRGMLNGLDPHSGFLSESDFKELESSTNGEFGGIGIELTMEDGVVKVIAPLLDTPAYKAGIKSGDLIVKLDQAPVNGKKLKEAADYMRGAPGSKLELTIIRKGINKPLVFNLVREKIEIKSVQSKLIDEKFGYVRLTQFQALTKKDMELAINSLKKQAGGDLSGLVLDLRNNPGGLFDSAVEVSDAFLESNPEGKREVIVYTEGRLDGSNLIAMSNQTPDLINHAPMVVLINNGSASASEIVAGALKDNKRALIVGTKSFGKGTVQTVLPIDTKRAIKLTTALYFTPSGTSIQAKGITPDIIIDEISVTPKNQESLNNFFEADLSGHIPNSNPEDPKKNINLATKNTNTPSVHDDYQLYAAITILKGLALAKR